MWTEKILNIIFPQKDLSKISINKCREAKQHNTTYIDSVFDYKDRRISELIWELKFYKNRKVAKTLAPMLYNFIKEKSILIPVPITKRKRRGKGFNQTELLCEEIIKIDTKNLLIYKPDLIIKIKNTKDQHSIKNRECRMQNLKDAFMVNDKSLEINNQNVVIIDDVFTTGTTILEIKKVLETAGAKSVRAITVAH